MKSRLSFFKTFLLLTMSVTILAIAGCHAKQSAILTPSIPLQETSLSDEIIKQCIINSAFKRGWTVDKTYENHIQLTIIVRSKHMATVDVEYSKQVININYLSSHNLRYEENEKLGKIIHKSYNRWVTYLADDIKNSLNIAVNTNK